MRVAEERGGGGGGQGPDQGAVAGQEPGEHGGRGDRRRRSDGRRGASAAPPRGPAWRRARARSTGPGRRAPSPGARRQAGRARGRRGERRRAGASVAPRSHARRRALDHCWGGPAGRACGDPRYANVPGDRPLGADGRAADVPESARRPRSTGVRAAGAVRRARERKGPGPPSPETATPARNRSSAPQRRAVGPSRAGRLPGPHPQVSPSVRRIVQVTGRGTLRCARSAERTLLDAPRSGIVAEPGCDPSHITPRGATPRRVSRQAAP